MKYRGQMAMTTKHKTIALISAVVGALAMTSHASQALAQKFTFRRTSRYAFQRGLHRQRRCADFLNDLFFQRSVQTYLWAMPALNMYGMKEGSEKVFGKGYNVLPIWKKRLNAKTLITTPNSDVIYALGYLDLKEDGPLVIEVPPGLQGIIDDFWQRPIPSVGEIDGRSWSGDVGLPGPDQGRGGKYLISAAGLHGRGSTGLFHLPFRHLWRVRLLAGFFQ